MERALEKRNVNNQKQQHHFPQYGEIKPPVPEKTDFEYGMLVRAEVVSFEELNKNKSQEA
jgi:hypothetical protein